MRVLLPHLYRGLVIIGVVDAAVFLAGGDHSVALIWIVHGGHGSSEGTRLGRDREHCEGRIPVINS